MKEEDKLKNKYGTQTGFSVPDGYFDTVFAKIDSDLPEYPKAQTVKSLSRWQRVKPYVYLAAMFGGIWCTMKMVNMMSNSQTEPVSLENPPAQIAQAMESPEVLAQVYSEPSVMVIDDFESTEIDDIAAESEQTADNQQQTDETVDEINATAGDEYFINVDDIDLNQLQAALYSEDSDDDEYYYI
ncbi:MAG: hypothetical protein NC402_00575 [Prevotella sp.]|nr:hypothetical protein [Prevotella sp.]MCM1074733.1 hypothetical protein [Ruminococcus sp.]